MNLVMILLGLMILAFFLYILNMILDKLLPSFGLDAQWCMIVKAIVGLFMLILTLGMLGLMPATLTTWWH